MAIPPRVLIKFSICIGFILCSIRLNAVECNLEGSQQAMNQCAYNDFAQADHALNRVYQAILDKEKNNNIYLQNLKKAQRAWVVFRDAELEALFFCQDSNKRLCWGSLFGMLYPLEKERLTRERTQQLEQHLYRDENNF